MVTCSICNKDFENNKDLTKHLVIEHGYNLKQVYGYYNIDLTQEYQKCIICGKDYKLDKRQLRNLKKTNGNKSIGCCKSCIKTLSGLFNINPFSKKEIQEKIKKTNLEKYGVENVFESKEIQDKIKKTNLEKYGVEYVSQNEEIQEKVKKTNLEKYGVENALKNKEIQEKVKKTNLEKYEVENVSQNKEIQEKIKKTNLEKYGVENVFESKEIQDKIKKTNLEKYGVEYPQQNEDIQSKTKKHNLEKYGVPYTLQSPVIRRTIEDTNLEKYGNKHAIASKEIKEKIKQVNSEKYGVENVMSLKEVRNKAAETMIAKYGAPYFCQHEACIKAGGRRISKLNKNFQEKLNARNISSELEYIIDDQGYDIKVGNILIELNPWYTHNTTIAPYFQEKQGKVINVEYHLEKTKLATLHGFRCVHIFDWDDKDKIIDMLKPKQKIYARKCEVRKLNKQEVLAFINKYHLQGNTKSFKYAYGLFYKEELVQVMTFGKPRYNKNYEYELLRLCTKTGYYVIGGAEKLLKSFEKDVKPVSIVSYCDLSKFTGDVYERLGFELKSISKPVKHWYNPKTKKHITDNLLRQRGFDQLHETSFGKGTSNEQLMIKNGYVEIYDCGQATYVKKI